MLTMVGTWWKCVVELEHTTTRAHQRQNTFKTFPFFFFLLYYVWNLYPSLGNAVTVNQVVINNHGRVCWVWFAQYLQHPQTVAFLAPSSDEKASAIRELQRTWNKMGATTPSCFGTVNSAQSRQQYGPKTHRNRMALIPRVWVNPVS